jgi:hypothetical protein
MEKETHTVPILLQQLEAGHEARGGFGGQQGNGHCCDCRWAEDLAGVYSAEEAAYMLGYSDAGPNPQKRLRNHHDEYLVEGGVAADEYHILAIFEGGGPERDVAFECSFYRISSIIPGGYFPGRRSNDALEDVEDDKKRDELVKAISGRPRTFPTL